VPITGTLIESQLLLEVWCGLFVKLGASWKCEVVRLSV